MPTAAQRLGDGAHPHQLDAVARRRRRRHDGPPEPEAGGLAEAAPGVGDLADLAAEADLADHDVAGRRAGR